ncbi:hypothetical protein [Arthrobacter zhaoxinii]|uniref:hypothetical protein n=1 Tax=Arthrobacter zhaoxinii TaxID=2964616 RepID=UPI00210520DD|nr:hypothetical protein [Arthrobacter zhaoxinii]MCQ1999540.1 hypothetical protein [Arthrobacter zhaoxinii]
MTTEYEERDALTPGEERLLHALKRERTDRRAAQRENAELRKFKQKFYEARDRAELWESRAIRYSERLKTMTIKNSPNKNKGNRL